MFGRYGRLAYSRKDPWVLRLCELGGATVSEISSYSSTLITRSVTHEWPAYMACCAFAMYTYPISVMLQAWSAPRRLPLYSLVVHGLCLKDVYIKDNYVSMTYCMLSTDSVVVVHTALVSSRYSKSTGYFCWILSLREYQRARRMRERQMKRPQNMESKLTIN